MAAPRISARHHLVSIAGLLVLTAAVFGQTIGHNFIALDDKIYITRNPHIADHFSWENLRFSLTDVVVSNWHPVTMLSHTLVAAAFGFDPGPHHAINVIIHALNACLLYTVLVRMTGAWWPSILASALFTVHPLRVEAVAWVTERKGLLCAFFVLLAMLAYERYARAPQWRWYVAVATAYLLALLSKPAAVAFPIALLLLDYWPLGRTGRMDGQALPLRRLVLEKVPLLIVAAVFSIVTYVVQERTGAVVKTTVYPFDVRAANAADSYARYLADTFAPLHLAIQYTHPGRAVFGPGLYAGGAVLLALSAAAVLARKRFPFLIVGWLWYLGMLVPAIGLVQVAHQARADRYTYLPYLGLIIAIVWSLDALRRRVPRAALPVTAAEVLWVLGLAGAAFVQTARWKDDYTLFRYTVAQAPESSTAHYCLGVAYVARGDFEHAEASFREAIRYVPQLHEAYSNLGAIELQRGDYANSAIHFARALELDPDNPELMVNLGVALFNMRQYAQAQPLAEQALQRAPNHARALELRDAIKAQAR